MRTTIEIKQTHNTNDMDIQSKETVMSKDKFQKLKIENAKTIQLEEKKV